MQSQIKMRTRTDVFRTVQFTGAEIIEALNQELKASGNEVRIPKDATIIVGVPGGGDWSNTELDLNDYPVEVRWTEITES